MSEEHNARLNARLVRDLYWDDRAHEWLSTWALTQEEAESIILHDTHPELDPHSSEAGHPIVRFKRGDVIIVVGLRNRDRPKVLSVFVNIPGIKQHKERTATGSGPGASIPRSMNELKKWIIDFGYKLEFTGGGHLAVIDKKTGNRVYTMPSTPSDNRSLANAWKGFLRQHTKDKAQIHREQLRD